MQCRPKADGKQMYTPDTKRCVSRDFFFFSFFLFFFLRVEGGRNVWGREDGEGSPRAGNGGGGGVIRKKYNKGLIAWFLISKHCGSGLH